MKQEHFQRSRNGSIALLVAVFCAISAGETSAAPSAEVAKKCMHYSYLAYPYKRPGSVRMSGDRQAYFKDCLTKEADIPQPAVAAKP